MAQATQRLKAMNLEDLPNGVSVLAVAVFRLSRTLRLAVSQIVSREEDIGLVAWRVLVGLNLVPDATQTELVDFTRTEQAQLSRVLKDMEARNLIRSDPVPGDRRSKIFSLTERGRTKHRILLPHVKRLTDALDAALTAEEREQFLSMCGRIAAASQKAGPNRIAKAGRAGGVSAQKQMEVTK